MSPTRTAHTDRADATTLARMPEWVKAISYLGVSTVLMVGWAVFIYKPEHDAKIIADKILAEALFKLSISTETSSQTLKNVADSLLSLNRKADDAQELHREVLSVTKESREAMKALVIEQKKTTAAVKGRIPPVEGVDQ